MLVSPFEDDGLPIGAIVGGVIGALALIAIIVIVVILVTKWKKRARAKQETNQDSLEECM